MRSLALFPLLLTSSLAFSADSGETQISINTGWVFTDQLEMLGPTLIVAPRASWWYNETIAIEGNVGLMKGSTNIGSYPYTALTPSVSLFGNLAPTEFIQPTLTLGIGAMYKNTADDGDLGVDYVNPDVDFLGVGGTGFMLPLGDSGLTFRADVRFNVNLGTESYRNRGDAFINWVFTGGIAYGIGGVKDSDKDGIADDADACPEEPEDFDEFEDEDGCPEPDNDKDGILDGADACPNDAEDMDEFNDEDGCPEPDNDEDGVLDGDDICPVDAGPEEFGGCPDTDEDGLPDLDDECPEEAGPENAEGCPDADGDRVPDLRDECPEEAADERINPKRSNGCPARVFFAKRQLIITETIQFNTGKATIKTVSHELLDEIAAALNKFKGVRKIEVGGHTDDVGNDEKNMTLSQERADSVKAYLVAKEVNEARLVTKGYGETKPVVENDSAANRATNRRVEFNIQEEDQPKARRGVGKKGKKGKQGAAKAAPGAKAAPVKAEEAKEAAPAEEAKEAAPAEEAKEAAPAEEAKEAAPAEEAKEAAPAEEAKEAAPAEEAKEAAPAEEKPE
jgi:outer membrane protein OmpA-like peptidoglycan-associated protein